MELSLISVEQQNSITVIQLKNPPANTLSIPVCQELVCAFSALPEETRVVILTGNETFFSAGANIKYFSLEEPEKNEAYFTAIYAALDAVWQCPFPVIAAVNGVSMGGGMELALCCDLRVVDESLRMGATSANMGLVFCTQRLPRLIGTSRAMELLLTARVIDGKEAKACGIACTVAESGQALAAALEIAKGMAAKPTVCLQSIKQAVREGENLPLASAVPHEQKRLFASFRTEGFRQQVTNFLHRKEKKQERN